MDRFFTGVVAIEQVLLAEVVALAGLLVVLRAWRAISVWRAHKNAARGENAATVLSSAGTSAQIYAAVSLPVPLITPLVGPVLLDEPVADAVQAQPVLGSMPATPPPAAAALRSEAVAVLPHPASAIVPRRAIRPRSTPEDTTLSPETLLVRAQDRLAAGALDDAAVQLRLCVRFASKMKQPAIEAVARLELGDLARASGDLTTACEHWQIARALFTDLKRTAEMVAAEKRMESAGCPTDWVLNQF